MDTDCKYVAIDKVLPSQHRYSFLNVRDKIKRAENQGYHFDAGLIVLHFDEGKSIYSVKSAIPVLKAMDSYVLCDGHHSVLASLEIGAKTVPIKIVGEWKGELDIAFWKWAAAENCSYLIDFQGQEVIPPPQDIRNLQDDPLRYFAAVTAYKIEEKAHKGKEAGEFLWIKIGNDIPFIEMRIADTLRKYGFSYKYGEELSQLSDLIEQARLILQSYPIPYLRLV